MKVLVSILRRIAGDYAFTWYGAVVYGVTTTIGSVSIYFLIPSEPTDSVSVIAIFLLAQLVATAVYLFYGSLYRFVPRQMRIFYVVLAFVAVCIIRAVVLDYVLHVWQLDQESKLLWRIRSNLIHGMLWLLGVSWLSDVYHKAKNQLQSVQQKYLDSVQELNNLEQARVESVSYGIREIGLDIAESQHMVGLLSSEASSSGQELPRLHSINNLLTQVANDLRMITSRQGVVTKFQPTLPKLTLHNLISAMFYSHAFLPLVSAVLAFAGLGGYLAFQTNVWKAEVATFIGGIFVYFSLRIIRRFNRLIGPARSIYIQILKIETTLAVVSLLWAMLTVFPLINPGLGAIVIIALNLHLGLNLISFIAGAISEIESQHLRWQSKILEVSSRIEFLRLANAQAESKWKELYASDIALSPTTATVMLRSVSLGSPEAAARLKRSEEIWQLTHRRLQDFVESGTLVR